MNKEIKEKFKNFWKKFWFVVWKDPSPKGWIISVISIFIVIKFIFFPVLNVATGTSLPLAIVESCSMYHDANMLSNFDEWWQNHEDKYKNLNIDKTEFEEFPLTKGFNKGDILFITGINPDNVKIGDVIIFSSTTKNPIIHRVIEINENDGKRTFSTIGDNNNGQLTIEKTIQESQIVGKAQLKIAPYIGWMKLIFFESSRSPQERGLCNEN